MTPSRFRDFVRSAGPLTVLAPQWRLIAARAVVGAEIVLAILLALSPVLHAVATVALVLAAVLLIAFTIAISVALRRGNRGACRCFGSDTHPLGAVHVWRNLLLLAVAAVGVAGAGWDGSAPAGVILAAVVGLVAGVLITRIDDLVDLFAPSGGLAGSR